MYICVLLIIASICNANGLLDKESEKNPNFWHRMSKKALDEALEAENLNRNKAKNVILFLGDGMGVSTITAGRIYKGQQRGTGGEETKLSMDSFPHAALSKTYCTDQQVADSAATATAYLCGVKTNAGILGMSSAATPKICQNSAETKVESILIDAAKAGKSTGIVTTTRIQHATPAGAYAHTPSREWYGDAELTEEARRNGCKDISTQFYEYSHMINVAMGGGRKYMMPNHTTDPEYPTKYNSRTDGVDLIKKWEDKMKEAGKNHSYVWNKEQFDNVDPVKTDHLLGLFERKDMNYEYMRPTQDGAGEPTLAEMTKKAIEILEKNDNGFFLLVEGGRIDHGHHASNAFLALNEVIAFDDAIEQAVGMTSDEETLIVVTADHSHVFTMGGYSKRGNDILGLAPSSSSPKKALDHKFYTTLLYGNGPGYQGHYALSEKNYVYPLLNHTSRKNVTASKSNTLYFLQQSAVPLSSETHGGEDVAILARGPMAHLFHSVHEQSYIAYAMRFASCLGEDLRHCPEMPQIDFLGMKVSGGTATSLMTVFFALLITIVVITILGMICLLRRRTRIDARTKEEEVNL